MQGNRFPGYIIVAMTSLALGGFAAYAIHIAAVCNAILQSAPGR